MTNSGKHRAAMRNRLQIISKARFMAEGYISGIDVFYDFILSAAYSQTCFDMCKLMNSAINLF